VEKSLVQTVSKLLQHKLCKTLLQNIQFNQSMPSTHTSLSLCCHCLPRWVIMGKTQ